MYTADQADNSSGPSPRRRKGGGDAEAKRRRRVSGYKSYAVESKVKASILGGFRWIKDKCSALIGRC
ncbi:hypothetical protein KSP39_PZI002681 [Platanthera zijinensis]|uniref:Uncharacterized protein n=1 Tax=Platanthera zijinensis TaxID=2320716 RepID=A0AAP0C110_9ASPA